MMNDLLAGILLIVAAGVLGAFLIKVILGQGFDFMIFSLSYPLGAGLWTWTLFLLSWIGLRINLTVAVLSWLLLTGLLIYFVRDRISSGLRGPISGWMENGSEALRDPKVVASLILGISLLAVAVLISIGRSHGRWDAAAGWVVKGYGIFLEQSVDAGARWGAWGLAYPLNLHLQNGLFWVAGAEELPASKLIFPIYLAAVTIFIVGYLLRNRVKLFPAMLGGLLILSNPLFFLHGTIGYANLPLAATLVPGGLLAIEAYEQRQGGLFLLSGVCFSVACWTRPEAIAYVLASIAAVVLVGLWLKDRLANLKHITYWLGPIVLVSGLWFLFGWNSVESSHLGKAMGGVLPRILAGEFRLWELYLIPRLLLDRALEPATWGILFPVAAILGLVGAVKLLKPRQYAIEVWTLALSISVALVSVSLFYVRSFTRYTDFIQLLNRSFDRAFIPAALLVATAALLLAFARGNSAPES